MKKHIILGVFVLIIFSTFFVNAFISKGFFYSDVAIADSTKSTIDLSIALIRPQIDLSEIPPFEIIDISKKMEIKGKTLIGYGLKYIELKESGHVALVFVHEGSNLSIDNNTFVNIELSLNPTNISYIELDVTGKIVSAELRINDKGGIYKFEEEVVRAPPKSAIYYYAGLRLDLKLPDDFNFAENPNFLNYLTNNPIRLSGENIILPNGEIVSGMFSYIENQVLLSWGDSIETRGIKVWGSGTKIFFDGKEHEGSYASFGDKTLFASSENSPVNLDFKEKNPYLKIDRGDYAEISVLKDAAIKIENRDEGGLIPKVTTMGKVSITEDSKLFSYVDGNILLDFPDNKGTTTTPIELVILKEDGSPTMGEFGYDSRGDPHKDFMGIRDMQGNKIIVDNFNRFGIFPEEEEGGNFSLWSWFPSEEFSPRLSYNYPTKEDFYILVEGPEKSISFVGLEKGNEDALLGRLREYYNSLTPKMKESLLDIQFMNDEEFEKAYALYGKNPSDVNAFALRNGTIIFRDIEEFDLYSFRHETAHQLHYVIKGVRKLSKSPFENKLSYLFDRLGISRKDEFEKKWKKTLLRDYSVAIGKLGKLEYIEEAGDNIGQYGEGPGYGFASPYGSTDIYEDVATLVEDASIPESFGSVLSQEDPYREIYKKKFGLLYEYEFISEETYNELLEIYNILENLENWEE